MVAFVEETGPTRTGIETLAYWASAVSSLEVFARRIVVCV